MEKNIGNNHRLRKFLKSKAVKQMNHKFGKSLKSNAEKRNADPIREK